MIRSDSYDSARDSLIPSDSQMIPLLIPDTVVFTAWFTVSAMLLKVLNL